MSARYSFTAILGQKTMQTALLASTVDPASRGDLAHGLKDPAKSTAARVLMLNTYTVSNPCSLMPCFAKELRASCHYVHDMPARQRYDFFGEPGAGI